MSSSTVKKGIPHFLVAFFVERRPLAHTLTLLFILTGIISYYQLPQELFPPILTNKIEITAYYQGTSADTFDDIITSRIEDEVQNIEGVKLIESVTRDGSCLITITLDDSTPVEDTLFKVRDAIDRVKPDFPEDMDDPTVVRKIEKYPLLTLSIGGAPEEELQDVADEIRKEIEKIPDISKATINGKAKREVHIYLKNDVLEALGITPYQVKELIKSWVNNSPLGEIKERGNHIFITTPGGRPSVAFWNSVILHTGGKKLYLSRIADIRLELSEVKSLSHFNGKRNISLTIFKTAKGSSIRLSNKIRKLVTEWKKRYEGLDFSVYSDLSVYIRNRLNTVKSSAVVGLILVTISLYLFLNLRVSITVLLGIPTAFLISFVYLYQRGETINMLSLFSFLMALGMVVDDAIVIGENIYRKMEAGLPPKAAAIEGTAEVFWPVCAATFTTVAAFLPLLMVGGDIGKFLKIIPIFVSAALLASLIESLFILPVHAVELYRTGVGKSPFSNWEPLRRAYARILGKLIDHKRLTIAGAVLFFALSILVMKLFLSFTLLSQFDADQIYIRGKLASRYGIEDTERVVSIIEKRVRDCLPPEDLDSIATHIGTSFNDKMEFDVGEDLFQVFVNLRKPAPQNFLERFVYPVIMFGTYEFGTRKHTAMDLVKVIERHLTDIKIQRLTVTKPKAGIVRADIEVSFSYPGKDKDEAIKKMVQAAHILEDALARIDGVENITDNYDPGKVELELRLNKRGRELGFSEASLASALVPYYLNVKTARIMKDVSRDVVVRTYLEDRGDIDRFLRLRLNVPGSSRLVYITDICSIVPKRGLSRIWKENGVRQVTVTASIDKNITTSRQVMKILAPTFQKIKELGVVTDIKGEKKVAEHTLRDLMMAGVVAILGILIVLLLQFNSFGDSFIVLISVPFAFVGVILGHLIMGKHLTITSLLGFVGLSGVAVNDAIIMVDFLKRHLKENPDKEHFIRAAAIRLRPIILTSVTTILSLTPLIFFATGQAMILSPMAISFGYGLLAATFANLLLVPTLYCLVHRVKFA
ncbi:MAG: efflux RND transporter permease subunit [Thermodesulfobacteria bacterium]|nr:efflux RND transporter permease subunit [Thermodesulfobacteriota bacterium]